jgi:hypothetical protein
MGHMKAHLWPYINQTLQQINIAENWNCRTNYYCGGNLPYKISIISAEWFMGLMEKFIYDFL